MKNLNKNLLYIAIFFLFFKLSNKLYSNSLLNLNLVYGFENYIESFEFSQNSQYLAALLWNNTLQLFEIKNNALVIIQEIKNTKNYKFSYDSRYLAITSWNNSLKLLDIKNNSIALELKKVRIFKFSKDNKNIGVIFESNTNFIKKPPKEKSTMKVFTIPKKPSSLKSN